MVRRNNQSPPSTPPSISPYKGIELLKRLREKGEKLLSSRPLKSEDHNAWENTAREYLAKAFGSDSANIGSVVDIGHYGSFPMNAPPEYWENHEAASLQKKLVMLDSLVELLETEIEISSPEKVNMPEPVIGEGVFLVHGHNEGIREAVARFLEKLDLRVTVLHEQPNAGRTVIEKFLDHSDVGFAVVLLTADDRGGIINRPYEDQLPRARQNVILELGFFLGKLGRKRVCALYQKGVEIPSDYQGILFIQLDDTGAWKLQLARELRATGLPIDMNKAL